MSILNDTVFIIQGPANYAKQVKESFQNKVSLIFSTWEDEECNFQSTDKVIFNKKPQNCGQQNLNLQKITTTEGLKTAKQLGFNYAVKWRSDMLPTNITNLLNCFNFLEKKLNFIFWVNHQHGYLLDYIMGGEIDNLLLLWNFPEKNYSYPEQALTENYLNQLKQIPIHFFGNQLNEQNDIFWIKNNLNLSSLKNNKIFSTQKP